MMQKILAATLGLAALGAVATTATPAAAQWGWHHHYYYRPYYRPYYVGPRVVVRPYYGRRCWNVRRTIRVGHHWERRWVRVCR